MSVVEKGFQSLKRKPIAVTAACTSSSMCFLPSRNLGRQKKLYKRVVAELQCCVPLLLGRHVRCQDPGTISGKSSSRLAGLCHYQTDGLSTRSPSSQVTNTTRVSGSFANSETTVRPLADSVVGVWLLVKVPVAQTCLSCDAFSWRVGDAAFEQWDGSPHLHP